MRVRLLIWVSDGEADWEAWLAVPAVTEVNGNCDSSSLVNMVICYFGPNIRALTMNVTIHLAQSLAENAVEQSFFFRLWSQGLLLGLQMGSQKISKSHMFSVFLNERASHMPLKTEYVLCLNWQNHNPKTLQLRITILDTGSLALKVILIVAPFMVQYWLFYPQKANIFSSLHVKKLLSVCWNVFYLNMQKQIDCVKLSVLSADHLYLTYLQTVYWKNNTYNICSRQVTYV